MTLFSQGFVATTNNKKYILDIAVKLWPVFFVNKHSQMWFTLKDDLNTSHGNHNSVIICSGVRKWSMFDRHISHQIVFMTKWRALLLPQNNDHFIIALSHIHFHSHHIKMNEWRCYRWLGWIDFGQKSKEIWIYYAMTITIDDDVKEVLGDSSSDKLVVTLFALSLLRQIFSHHYYRNMHQNSWNNNCYVLTSCSLRK